LAEKAEKDVVGPDSDAESESEATEGPETKRRGKQPSPPALRRSGRGLADRAGSSKRSREDDNAEEEPKRKLRRRN
jgi:hypothetical protein